ncbi:MAG TPA: HAMP domain-containing sensor histidine kinase [Micromonosporaceae bacterium]|nr:HAMP domain-containing sensor histidine kinase [Micromonosporaceae bacterium]
MPRPDDLTVPLALVPRAGTGRQGRARHTLTARAVLVTCAVAVVSVLVTALVAFPLALRSAEQERREALAEEATVVAAVMTRTRLDALDERLAAHLREQGIDVVLVLAGRPDRPGLPESVVAQVSAGVPVTGQRVRFEGRPVLVEGRPIGRRAGVLLVQPIDSGTARAAWRRLWLALLAGLVAGAGAGALLARRLARPLRNAATAAARLSAGDRGVRLAVEPPVEVADLARAINELAGALATSEGRQRDFLLSVSHELRTPLTTIKGYAEALADGVVGAEGAQRAGQTVLAEAEHLDRLVTDLLALARLEAADFTLSPLPVDLADLVAGIAEAWGGRCAAVGVVLRTELPPGPVVVHTDPGRVRQVIEGLLENALRVVPAGAPVVLAVRGEPAAGLVEVRDGGPGFTDADLAVAFERGALQRRYAGVRKVGSGLGLALAARLVRRLGGGIEAGHAAEGGARLAVRLPYPAPAYPARTSG